MKTPGMGRRPFRLRHNLTELRRLKAELFDSPLYQVSSFFDCQYAFLTFNPLQ